MKFLQEHRRLTYINLLTSGMLDEYLSEIDKQAWERFCRIVKQLKIIQGIPEQLKVDNPMEWVKRMNGIRQQAEDIVIKELLHNRNCVHYRKWKYMLFIRKIAFRNNPNAAELQSIYFRGCYDSGGYLNRAGI